MRNGDHQWIGRLLERYRQQDVIEDHQAFVDYERYQY